MKNHYSKQIDRICDLLDQIEVEYHTTDNEFIRHQLRNTYAILKTVKSEYYTLWNNEETV